VVSRSDCSALDAATPPAATHLSDGERATERAKLDADASRLLALWPRLAPHVRAGLVAMAQAAAQDLYT